jgi:fructokinase
VTTAAVLGEALIDFIAGDGGTYRPHLGGSPYNVAIGLARQGIEVNYLSPLSDDIFGDRIFEALRLEGVQMPQQRRSRWPTSLALVTVDERGQPTYRLYRQGVADKDASFADVAGNLPDDLRVFHTGSLAITPSQLPKIRKLLALMRDRGAVVSIDINIRLRASIDTRRYLDGVRTLLGAADIVKASDEDLEAFELDADAGRSAEILHAEMGAGILVRTQGAGGATLYHDRGTIHQRAYPVADPVDTVGAGDSFHSALLAFLWRSGKLTPATGEIGFGTLREALNYACAAAAISLSRAGCSPPTQSEVTGYIASAAR